MGRHSNKTLIVIRHAHRDKDLGHEYDNGISEKGVKQTAKMAKYFRLRYEKSSPLILSSPKRRCQETVEPIAKRLGLKVQSSALLDERREGEGGETAKMFDERVAEFLRWWKLEAPELIVACSHGDWIPLFLRKATGVRADLSKAGWAEMQTVGGDEAAEPELTWLLQEYD